MRELFLQFGRVVKESIPFFRLHERLQFTVCGGTDGGGGMEKRKNIFSRTHKITSEKASTKSLLNCWSPGIKGLICKQSNHHYHIIQVSCKTLQSCAPTNTTNTPAKNKYINKYSISFLSVVLFSSM